MRSLCCVALCLGLLAVAAPATASLRFFGHGVDMLDRAKIRLDDPTLSADIGPPADVGASDFTLEFPPAGPVYSEASPFAGVPLLSGPAGWLLASLLAGVGARVVHRRRSGPRTPATNGG